MAQHAQVVGAFAARHLLGKPDQAELIAIKHPDLPSIAWGALNELAYRARTPVAPRLTTLNVEITNRCNLRCTYCPVNRTLERPRGDLPFELFREILERAPTVRTLLPFQWGEPLLHENVFDMIRFAAERGIRVYLTSNGTRLDPEHRRALLAAGLTRLTVSVDGDDETHRRTRGVELAPIRERLARLKRERDLCGAPMRIDVSMVLDATTEHAWPEFEAAWRGVADRVAAIPRMVRGARGGACREPWRGLLVVLCDGRITTCCADVEGRLALGDARTGSAARIFNGAAMRRLRDRHARGDLPDPCATCGEFEHPSIRPRFR